ncbi:MAG: acyltransferase, partial [Terricaulis silvestris]
MRYRADIDGLRALAVLPVLAFHAGLAPFSGGFVGVDVFFVISGFLITGMIVAEAEEGRFSLVRFYERRARRILPALIAMIALIAIPVSILLIPETLKAFGASAAAAVLSVSNIFFWREAGYFDLSAAQAPLLHTWSLGVEEQFYIFFPIYLVVMRRLTGWSWLRIIGALAILSLIIGIVLVRFSEKAAFYLPMGRMWELALGGLLAVGGIPRLGRIAN